MKSAKPQQIVHVPLGEIRLEGELIIPAQTKGIVLFAHGSGSSRFSPRNLFVANFLREHLLATLLIDLLTAEEEKIDQITQEMRFDIGLLAQRLIGITEWLFRNPYTQDLQVGYFGSSTGAAAALIAAAKLGSSISAVVSRGGRPDLAGSFLPRVEAPTLLIVGGADGVVIELNQEAYDLLPGKRNWKLFQGRRICSKSPGLWKRRPI